MSTPFGAAPAALVPAFLPAFVRGLVVALLLGALAACKTAPVAPPENLVPVAERPYLVAPTTGYPLTVAAEDEARAHALHAALTGGAAPATVAADAAALAAARPGFHPAVVVAAQAELAAGDAAAARQRLEPVVDELPDYVAALLVLGRAAEQQGDAVAAYLAFRSAGRSHALAATRAAELRPAALAATYSDFETALARGRDAEAEAAAARLAELAPEARQTLEAAVALAASRTDDDAELAALRRLHAAVGDERPVVERLAELEVAAGELAVGLERLESLVAAHPGDAALADKLEAARFRWRLDLLPPPVQEIAGAPALDRGEVATLLYWLFPEIRSAQAEDPPVATDVLDHPRRDELLRVIGLGLLDVDAAVHRFHPERRADRATVLAALLRLLERSGGDFACLGESAAAGADPGAPSWVCRQAAACGLLPTVDDCLGESTVSGAEALELVRRALGLLDAQ